MIILIYTYDKNFDVEIDLDFEIIRERLYEIVLVNNIEEIKEDILKRDYEKYAQEYFIVTIKGHIRGQSRVDTFSRHYLIRDSKSLADNLMRINIQTDETRERIDIHMKGSHIEYTSDCDMR